MQRALVVSLIRFFGSWAIVLGQSCYYISLIELSNHMSKILENLIFAKYNMFSIQRYHNNWRPEVSIMFLYLLS